MSDRLFGILTGRISLKIEGFEAPLLAEKLREICKVKSLYAKDDALFATIPGNKINRVQTLCESQNCVYEILERRGTAFKIKKYLHRFGFAFGVILASALIFYLSNTVVKIEINGAYDDAQRVQIRELLATEGVKPGAYIPSLNFMKISTELFSKSDEVAWASLGSVGSVVYVNVSMSTNKPEAESTRIPTNIVAARDAVIVSAKVLTGQLSVLVGDAVHKGQMLVSGLVEYDGGAARYYHSRATIIGRYEDRAVFSQNYRETSTAYGEKIYRKSLGFFDLEIPLPSEMLKRGAEYSVKTQTVPVKLIGFTLPFSVKTYEYTEIVETERTYSKGEALSILYKRMDNYEKNLLAGSKIISRKVHEIDGGDGISLEVDYEIEGDIGSPSEIFAD